MGVGLSADAQYRTSVDLYLSGGILVAAVPRIGLSAYGAFSGRPFRKKVLVRIGDGQYMQYREHRVQFEAGLDETLLLSDIIGVYARAGVGYTHAWYNGSIRRAPTGATAVFGTGLHVGHAPASATGGAIRVGYVYANLKAASPHGITVSGILYVGGSGQ